MLILRGQRVGPFQDHHGWALPAAGWRASATRLLCGVGAEGGKEKPLSKTKHPGGLLEKSGNIWKNKNMYGSTTSTTLFLCHRRRYILSLATLHLESSRETSQSTHLTFAKRTPVQTIHTRIGKSINVTSKIGKQKHRPRFPKEVLWIRQHHLQSSQGLGTSGDL